MTVLTEGDNSFFLSSQAILIENDRDVASDWASKHITTNKAIKWVLGKYVEADNANSNGQYWQLEDLRMSQPSIKHSPMNVGHRPHNIVGTFVASEMIYPTGVVPVSATDDFDFENDGSWLDLESSAEKYSIPDGVKKAAQRGLELHKKLGRGGTSVGMNTARILSAGGSIGIEKVKHISRYFPRHAGDNLDDKESNGWVAWLLWGGDAGRTWSTSIVERYNKENAAYAPMNPYIEALGAFWKYYFPGELAQVEAAYSTGNLFLSMECVSSGVTCAGPNGCGKSFDYAGPMSDTYCEHIKERASYRQLDNPHFLAGALVLPPDRPGWKGAEVKEISKIMDDYAAEAERAYAALTSESPHLSESQLEATVQLLLMRSKANNMESKKPAKQIGKEIADRIINSELAADKRLYFKVQKGAKGCPTDKPYGVVGEKSGTVHGCHPSEAAAQKQLTALYAATDPKKGWEPKTKDAKKNVESPKQHDNRVSRESSSSDMEGEIASFKMNDSEAMGRIEYVMTDGSFGLEGSKFYVEASGNDPVLLLRILESSDSGWQETELMTGRRLSEVDIFAGSDSARMYSGDERKKMAKSGDALPDGSYPIANIEDLKNAIQAFGRAKNKPATKRHIMKRARELNAEDLIPDNWK